MASPRLCRPATSDITPELHQTRSALPPRRLTGAKFQQHFPSGRKSVHNGLSRSGCLRTPSPDIARQIPASVALGTDACRVFSTVATAIPPTVDLPAARNGHSPTPNPTDRHALGRHYATQRPVSRSREAIHEQARVAGRELCLDPGRPRGRHATT